MPPFPSSDNPKSDHPAKIVIPALYHLPNEIKLYPEQSMVNMNAAQEHLNADSACFAHA